MKKSPLNMVGIKSPLNMIEDKAHTHASKKDSVGIVGESQIWDGPLDQQGRFYGVLRRWTLTFRLM